METILIILCVVAAILLVLAVLVQPGKAEMISGMGGLGGQAMNLFGVRESRNFLQNFTIGLTAFIMVVSVLTNKFFMDQSTTSERTPVTQGAALPADALPIGTPAPTKNPTPAQPAPEQAQPAQPDQNQQ